jgi:hypothetical protein
VVETANSREPKKWARINGPMQERPTKRLVPKGVPAATPEKRITRQCESGETGLTWEVAPMSVVASNRFRADDEERVLSCILPGQAHMNTNPTVCPTPE